MSYWLNVMLNNIKVIQGDNFIEVRGIRVKPFFHYLSRVFGTVRFNNGMFTDVQNTSFRVSRFFLYDFWNIMVILSEKADNYYNNDIITKLHGELSKIEDISRLSRKYPTKFNREQLKKFKFAPLPHQEEFFNYYDVITQKYNLNGYILASAPGTGKTISSLMLMAMLEKDVTFIFSPNNALNDVWKSTLSEVQGTKVWCYPEPLTSFKYTHYVFSHENTKYALEAITKILRAIRGESVGVIVDECHRFTEMASALTNNLIDICRLSHSEDILFMSGTPFKAMGRELIPFIMATDPTFTAEDLDGFRKIFGASGNNAKEILSARIGRVMYKIGKEEIFNNDVTELTLKVKIPGGERFTLIEIRKKMKIFIQDRTKYYQENKKKFDDQYLKIIDDFSKTSTAKNNSHEFTVYKQYVQIIRNSNDYRELNPEIKFTNSFEKNVIMPTLSSADKVVFKNVKTIYKYLPLKIQGEALGKILGRERVECNVQLVKHLDQSKVYCEALDLHGEDFTIDDIFSMSKSKVVMFTDYIEVVLAADKVLKAKGFQPALIYGETNKDLSGIIEKAKKNPRIDPLIATYKSLSTAVPLIFCSTVVLINSPFRNYIYEQTTARVDRLGQNNPINIFTCELDTGGLPNISTRSKDILEWSKKMVDDLLGFETIEIDEDDILEGEVVTSIESYKDTSLVSSSLFSQW